jgi:hypothetical protein
MELLVLNQVIHIWNMQCNILKIIIIHTVFNFDSYTTFNIRFNFFLIIKVWGSNGPTLIIETLKLYCEQKDIYSHLKYETSLSRKSKISKCSDINIFPESYFYPYNYKVRNYNNFSIFMQLSNIYL